MKMSLIEKVTAIKPRAPTADDAPRGNLDDELRAEANDRLTQSPYDKPSHPLPSVPPTPRNAMPSPFDLSPHTAQPKRMAFTLTPNVRSLILTTDQEVESHVEEKDGRVTLTLKWLAMLAVMMLTSCAGATFEPCVSVTTASGKEVKACVRIETREEEGKRSGGEEEE